MKRSAFASIALSLGAILSSSCASAPAPVVPAAAREETVTVRVPVLTTERVYLPDGTLDRTISYTLDADLVGILSRVTVEAGRAEPVETLRRAIAAGSIVETLFDADAQVVSRKTIEFDAAGRKVRETVEGSAKERGTVSEWSYGADGNPSEWRVSDAAGARLAVTRYEYAGGRLSLARMFDPAGALEGTQSSGYDADGRLVSRVLSDAAGKVERTERFVWKSGRLVEESVYGRSGALERRATHEYGPEGEVRATTVYDAGGRVRERREFDYVWRLETRVVPVEE